MSEQYFKLNNNPGDIITPEQKMAMDPFLGGVKLNFKLFFDFNSKKGLLADKSNTNSALAYLKRIGEDVRFQLLEEFIESLKKLQNEYEYLFQSVEGLQEIFNAKLYENFGTQDDKIFIKIQESLDFKIQALNILYKNIIYDGLRGVQVIPKNLLYFNMRIFVFNYGYYNSLLYDAAENNSEKKIIEQIFPTKKKLVHNNFKEMNHIFFNLVKCKFVDYELGKDFFSDVSNTFEGDNFVNQGLSILYNYASYNGRFNNIYGEVDLGALLAIDTMHKNDEENIKNIELTIQKKKKKTGIWETQKNNLKRKLNQLKGRVQIVKDTWKKIKSDDFKQQMVNKMVDAGQKELLKDERIKNAMNKISNIDSFVAFTDLDTINVNTFKKAAKNIELGLDYNIYDGNI